MARGWPLRSRPSNRCPGTPHRASGRRCAPRSRRISYADGRVEHYQLLVAYVAPGTAPAGLPGRARNRRRPRRGRLRGRPGLPAGDDGPDRRHSSPSPRTAWTGWTRHRSTPAAAMRLFTGEQSNTTVMVGDATLFKLFRKLEPGRNLDAEVLARPQRVGHHPRPLRRPRSGRLRPGDVLPAGAGRHRRLAPRHRGLRGRAWTSARSAVGSAPSSPTSTTAWPTPSAPRSCPGTELAAAMLRRFDAAADQVGELEDYRHAAQLLFDSAGAGALATQRVHGDFHLGQVLYREAEHAWVIIDFEGEPLKTLAERRELDSVWRDVAGLLRSLDYARSAHARSRGPRRARMVRAARARRSSTATAGHAPRGAGPAPRLPARQGGLRGCLRDAQSS